jgi:DNA-binding NarL/FixJ family response regulator
MKMKIINIGIVDDHKLFLKTLRGLIDQIPAFNTVLEASNGKMLIKKLQSAETVPDILLLDVNMPFMNGIEAARVISRTLPQIKMIALTMKDDSETRAQMLEEGCRAYLYKDIDPDELQKAILEVNEKGYYSGDGSI